MPGIYHRATQRMMDQITKDPFVGAWKSVAVLTFSVTVAGGLLVRLTDPDSFSNVWEGLWWSIQTVTTVGYGDVVPASTPGRLVAAAVMIGGIGFITVTTAAIASAFVESARRRREGAEETTRSEVDELRDEVAALTREIKELKTLITDARGGTPPG